VVSVAPSPWRCLPKGMRLPLIIFAITTRRQRPWEPSKRQEALPTSPAL
jgi:hypothetical protein